MPNSAEVSLKVFNIIGEEVATLVSEQLTTGNYRYEWSTSQLIGLASGVYIYRLVAGDPSTGEQHRFVESKKMVLIR